MGPRTRSHVTIWNLPEELILEVVRTLPVKDVLNMMAVHSYFYDLIKDNPVVWANVSFKETWPSVTNVSHFKKAAELGNFEAAIKLAIAYLYHEGLPWKNEETKPSNGDNAAQMFCLAESLNKCSSPFTWLFIRPPWSQCGSCCKQCVFNKMTNFKSDDPSTQARIHICLAKIFNLLDMEDKSTYTATHLQAAMQNGSSIGAYLLWQQKYGQMITDRAQELASVRDLRDIASHGDLEPRLHLCHFYANAKYGGVTKDKAAMFVRETMQASRVSEAQNVFATSHALTPSMRYILVDWLVEVVGMKDFSSQVLHVTIGVIDRFLTMNHTPRSKLQLLGVSALVLCSRYLGRDIITIREAAWLTDNTYKYEDVVRMMGEITAALKGNFRVPTILDYTAIISELVGLGSMPDSLAYYISELTLLQAKMGQYTHAQIAACSVILAKVLLHSENCWTPEVEKFTGFTIEQLTPCLIHMYKRCYIEGSVIAHRDVTLQAVKDRYSVDKHHNVGKTHLMAFSEVCSVLGISDEPTIPNVHRRSLHRDHQLIKSPSRSCQQHALAKNELCEPTRTLSTPSIDPLNDSVMSGYEGDMEDEPDCDMDVIEENQVTVPSFIHDDDTYFATLSNLVLSTTTTFLDLSQQLSASCQKSAADQPSSSGVSSLNASSSPTSFGATSFGATSFNPTPFGATSFNTTSVGTSSTLASFGSNPFSVFGKTSFSTTTSLPATSLPATSFPASARVPDSSSDPDSDIESGSVRKSRSMTRSWTSIRRSLKRKRSAESSGATKTIVLS